MNKNKIDENAEAKREAPFTAKELLAEIKPLIEDYFVGEFYIEDDKIVCKFLNGQTFFLTTKEKE